MLEVSTQTVALGEMCCWLCCWQQASMPACCPMSHSSNLGRDGPLMSSLSAVLRASLLYRVADQQPCAKCHIDIFVLSSPSRTSVAHGGARMSPSMAALWLVLYFRYRPV